MNSAVDTFLELPRPAKAAIVGLSATTTLALALAFDVFAIVLVGVCVIAAALLGYRTLLKWRKKRKADPFEDEVKNANKAVPKGVTDPAVRAKLDDLRRKFDNGILTFRTHGKDLFSLPWYVIIGEPGSGKTEAIRHCGIGFPPGLQNELQGSGGTINMDWWFTDHAVILDTAGRLTFGDVAAVDNEEWMAFLKLLKKHRAGIPINGLIISIPVDSLIMDDAGAIEQKAGKLRRQLDLIQRTLEVRFPVFVIVTKADKMTGFREFFGSLRDPAAQGQMLGWSNPAPLDEPFQAASVDQHLRHVKERLVRRRMGIIKDPVHTEDPSARRTDQVDELYALTEALEGLTSRLKHYLGLIFAPGAWSSKPVFLRGIYFTSSMQHGTALDKVLAEAAGVPLESLKEKGWTTNRAYFLHDVFREKVFQERGLVTGAVNASALQRKRRYTLLGAGFGAAFLFAVFSIWAVFSLGSVTDKVEFWKTAAESAAKRHLPVVFDEMRTPTYAQDRPLVGNDRLADFFPRCREQAELVISTPLAFKPVAWRLSQSGFFKDDRLAACQSLFEQGVIEPLAKLARDGLGKTEWSNPDTVTALAQLIDIGAAASAGAAPRSVVAGSSRTFQIDPMLRFVLGDKYPGYGPEIARDAAQLQEVCDWLYGSAAADANRPWPSPFISAAVADFNAVAAVDKFNNHWLSSAKSEAGGNDLARLEQTRQKLADFKAMEDQLLTLNDTQGTLDLADWQPKYNALATSRTELEELLKQLNFGAEDRLSTRLDIARKTVSQNACDSYKELLAAAEQRPVDSMPFDCLQAAGPASSPPPTTESEAKNDTALQVNADGVGARTAAALRRGWEKFVSSMSSSGKPDASKLDDLFLVTAGERENRQRLYAIRFAMYEKANSLLTPATAASALRFGDTHKRLTEIASTIKAATARIDELARRAPPGAPLFAKAQPLSRKVAETLGGSAQSTAAADAFVALIKKLPNAQAISAEVARQVGDTSAPLPKVPLTKLTSESNGYRGDVALDLFRDYGAVSHVQPQSRDLTSVRAPLGEYAQAYFDYLTNGILDELKVSDDTWAAFDSSLDKLDESDITPALMELGTVIGKRLDDLGEILGGMVPKDCPLDAKSVTAAAQSVKGAVNHARTARGDYEKILKAWRALHFEATLARASLVNVSTDSFIEEYCPRFNESDDRITTFIEAFWARFALRGLDLLVEAARDDANQAWKDFAQLSKFPLSRSKFGGEHLTARQVKAASQLVDTMLALESTVGPGSKPLTKIAAKADGLLASLRAPLDTVRTTAVRKCKALLNSLVTPGKPFEVMITVLPNDPATQEDKAQTNAVWRYVQLEQGPGKLGLPPFVGGGDKEVLLGTVKYPDVAFQLGFWRTDAGADPDVRLVPSIGQSRRAVFDGSWAVLALLAEWGATRVDDVPPAGGQANSTWKAELLLSENERDNKVYSLWLKLEFKSPIPIPPLSDWPE